MEFMKYNFMGNKADENVPDQDLSSTTESNFDDINAETARSDSQDNFSSATLTALQLMLNKVIITTLL